MEARLFHQATTRAYVEALAAANLTDGKGELLRSIWESTGRAAPVLMTSAQTTAQLTHGAARGDRWVRVPDDDRQRRGAAGARACSWSGPDGVRRTD